MRLRPLLAVALLAGSLALADNTADEADVAFSLGNQHFVKREYEPALSQYFLSWRLVPNRNVLFNIARCYEALEKLDEAYRYYHDLSKDPKLAADDAKDVKVALARLAPKVALVTVTTTPPGADLYIDREDLGSRGQTPQTIAVAPGPHTVTVKLPGHRTATAKLSAGRGQDAKQNFPLERIVGRVRLSGTPEGASVRDTAEGPELGRLPATLDFTPGQRLLVVQAKGFLPSQVLVDVKPDETAEAKVALVEKPKPTGKVVVTATRENAVVRVDGKESGFTPVVLTLIEGRHTVTVTTEEVEPFERTLEVAADSETRLFADLHYAPPKVQAASKTALSVDQAPASVTVITREELRAFGYQTLSEALTGVRGLFFTDDRIYTYIGIRGFSPQGDLNTRILMLYDGHAMNDVWAGQGYSARDLDVDLAEVDRIEVVRGPTSSLFGTGAFFGVINIIPRERLGERRHAEGVTGVGGQGGAKARVTGSLGDERASLLVSAGGFQSKGAELTDLGDQGLVHGIDGERSLGASVRGHLGGFTLTGKVNQRRKQIPTAPFGSAFDVKGTEYMDARGFAELRYTTTVGPVSVLGRVTYDGSRYEGTYAALDGADITLEHDTGGGDWLGAEARAGLEVFTGNTASLSLEGQGQFVYQHPQAANATDWRNRTVVSATLLDEWQLHPKVFLQAGVRADKYSDVTTIALSPRVALVARPYAEGVSKLVAGRAFRAPTIYELYFNDGNLSQRAPLGGLKPEYITTFELEHSHDLSRELRLTVGAYYNLIDDLIEVKEDPPTETLCANEGVPLSCVAFRNTPLQLTALGAEAQLRWQPGRFTLVDATASYVVLDGPGRQGAPPYPSLLTSLRAMAPLKEGYLRVSGQLTWQAARRDASGTNVGEALLLDAGLSGDYGVLRYFAGVKNLLDQRYVLPAVSEASARLLPQYGRTFWFELTAGF